MLEIHDLLFGFMIPFWEDAVAHPVKRFPETFEYLNEHVEEGPVRELKRRQILAGIKGGHQQLLKMSKKLLTAPLVFLVLSDPVRGPPLLRVIIALLDMLYQ